MAGLVPAIHAFLAASSATFILCHRIPWEQGK